MMDRARILLFVTVASLLIVGGCICFAVVWGVIGNKKEAVVGPCEPGDTRNDYVANGTDIVITSNLPAYLVEPTGSCSGAVIVVHDIHGYEVGATRLIADELAMHGYTAVLPDLFRGNPWKGGDWGQYYMWSASHPQERVDQDVLTTVDYLQTEKGMENVGIVGFCWGGKQVVLATKSPSTKIQAAVGFYGTGISVDEALAMSAPTLLIFAQNDTVQPLADVRVIENALQTANKIIHSLNADDSELTGPATYVKIFEDADHAFAHRANRSDPVAAAKADEAKQDMFAWLERYLPMEEKENVIG